ncbi:hypothetical protein HYQ45_002697 [Verticillium longisporum]|uniref:LYR motif-containing protein Cup1-like N-terminal domain-containing protein n=1 Tax=Verticillium longisporum TaxID=100787 RepID=A0A8I2ZZQ5_VERLO|nr:hypothetical protein HYQ44_017479 [Verticillium longisporum]KAG7140534.1 hypothetical protein HYQ45_002697 [Verticillium longisporum]
MDRFKSTRDTFKTFKWTGKPNDTLEKAAREARRRTKAALWEGDRHLRRLRAANAGDVARMQRILRLAFGRLGKRRRELMADLLRQDPPSDTAALEARLSKLDLAKNTTDNSASRKKEPPLKPRTPDHWDTENLLAYLRSQKQRDLDTLKTILGRPMPERRLRIRREKWWKHAADRVMPPLAKAEWDSLAQAALGNLPIDQYKPLPRRPLARSKTPEINPAQKSWNWTPYADRPASLVERPRAVTNVRLVDEPEVGPYGGDLVSRIRPLSSRQFRRQYRQIYESSSFAEQHPTTLKMSFQWGTRGQPPVATPAQLQRYINSAEVPEPDRDVKKKAKA